MQESINGEVRRRPLRPQKANRQWDAVNANCQVVASSNMLAIRKAQAAAAARPEFKAAVTFVKTTAFARPREQSPNVGHGHHWFGNAESYFLIGDAMGQAMNKLLSASRGQ
jgi:hypothetical protein